MHSGAQSIRPRREAAPAQIPLSLSKAREMYTLQCLAEQNYSFYLLKTTIVYQLGLQELVRKSIS